MKEGEREKEKENKVEGEKEEAAEARCLVDATLPLKVRYPLWSSGRVCKAWSLASIAVARRRGLRTFYVVWSRTL